MPFHTDAAIPGATPELPLGPWRAGENVPWSVSWTGEQYYELQISNDFPGLIDLTQTNRPGDGLPKFAALHVTRHRMAMVKHLCHVCGKPTEKRDRYIFPAESGGFVTLPDDTRRYAGNVPPVHLACARRAQKQCPHLRQAYAQPIPYPVEESRLMPRTDVMPGMEKLASSMPQNLTIVYSCYRLHGRRFTARVEELRAKAAHAAK